MSAQFWSTSSIALHWFLAISITVRIVKRRAPIGTSLAWLFVTFAVPLVGAALYFMIGERRKDSSRNARFVTGRKHLAEHLQDVKERGIGDHPSERSLGLFVQGALGFPVASTNSIELLSGYEATFAALIQAIDEAESHCYLEFYIWHPGGKTQDLRNALIRAAERGVDCRVLVDAMGSSDFLDSEEPDHLSASGVKIGVSLPVSFFGSRWDLRNHRKIFVIDGNIAFTGSQNLVDPRFFKQDAGVGEWVDAMVRVDGDAAICLEALFLRDWQVETDTEAHPVHRERPDAPDSKGPKIRIQTLPSGPEEYPDAVHQVILGALYGAVEEIVFTTPYFVPDDAVLNALQSAAVRGVNVIVVLPKKNDSLLVRFASAAVFESLLDAGVTIAQYGKGLLHTKSMTVDGQFSMFGSVNLDIRSLWLNAEISLLVYDQGFTSELRELQASYIEDSTPLDAERWRERGNLQRLAEGVLRLFSPIL